MRYLTISLVTAMLALGLPVGGGGAAGKLRIVASVPDLKALTDAVGGDLVEVDTQPRRPIPPRRRSAPESDGQAAPGRSPHPERRRG